MQKQTSSQKRAVEEEKDAERLASIAGKYTRIDGKELSQKQKREIIQQMKEKEKAENPEFDPRRHRLTHGIRNYREVGQQVHEPGAFQGTGTAIGMTR